MSQFSFQDIRAGQAGLYFRNDLRFLKPLRSMQKTAGPAGELSSYFSHHLIFAYCLRFLSTILLTQKKTI